MYEYDIKKNVNINGNTIPVYVPAKNVSKLCDFVINAKRIAYGVAIGTFALVSGCIYFLK